MNSKHPILALVGPTASGKSDFAFELAKRYQACIVNCDSLLIYKNLNIGTAKPSTEEQQIIDHFMLDLIAPNETYNVADYCRQAKKIIEREVERRPVIIVGGTGFYLKALLCGVWKAPPTNPQLRQELDERYKLEPSSERNQKLHQRLQSLDPNYAAKIHPNDYYRVVRGIEIVETTGLPVEQSTKDLDTSVRLDLDVSIIGIDRTKLDIEKRITQRTNAMFAQGLVAESKDIIQNLNVDLENVPKSLQSVGYAEVITFLKGKTTITECRERVVISTRQLVKKQRTFFNTFPKPIQWFELPKNETELEDFVSSFFKKKT